jgi:hypothetical protein
MATVIPATVFLLVALVVMVLVVMAAVPGLFAWW